MTRVLSILAVACFIATNVGAAPVHDHLKPQAKTSTDPKVTNSSNTPRSNQPSKNGHSEEAQSDSQTLPGGHGFLVRKAVSRQDYGQRRRL